MLFLIIDYFFKILINIKDINIEIQLQTKILIFLKYKHYR